MSAQPLLLGLVPIHEIVETPTLLLGADEAEDPTRDPRVRLDPAEEDLARPPAAPCTHPSVKFGSGATDLPGLKRLEGAQSHRLLGRAHEDSRYLLPTHKLRGAGTIGRDRRSPTAPVVHGNAEPRGDVRRSRLGVLRPALQRENESHRRLRNLEIEADGKLGLRRVGNLEEHVLCHGDPSDRVSWHRECRRLPNTRRVTSTRSEDTSSSSERPPSNRNRPSPAMARPANPALSQTPPDSSQDAIQASMALPPSANRPAGHPLTRAWRSDPIQRTFRNRNASKGVRSIDIPRSSFAGAGTCSRRVVWLHLPAPCPCDRAWPPLLFDCAQEMMSLDNSHARTEHETRSGRGSEVTTIAQREPQDAIERQ